MNGNNLEVLGKTYWFDYMYFFSINTTYSFSKQTEVVAIVISALAVKISLLGALMFLWYVGLTGWILALLFRRICRTEQKD